MFVVKLHYFFYALVIVIAIVCHGFALVPFFASYKINQKQRPKQCCNCKSYAPLYFVTFAIFAAC